MRTMTWGVIGADPTAALFGTIHFREPLRSDEAGPVLVRFTTIVVAEGFVEEDGEIWSEDGRLLAQSRQLALVLPVNASSTSARQSNHS